MDIGRSIKDFFLLTPYFIILIIGIIYQIIIHLLFGFTAWMIFIYEEIKGKRYGN